MIDKKAVLEMLLFNNPSNNFSSIDKVGFVKILYFSIDTMLIKYCSNY